MSLVTGMMVINPLLGARSLEMFYDFIDVMF
jgi:hypothetical protein